MDLVAIPAGGDDSDLGLSALFADAAEMDLVAITVGDDDGDLGLSALFPDAAPHAIARPKDTVARMVRKFRAPDMEEEDDEGPVLEVDDEVLEVDDEVLEEDNFAPVPAQEAPVPAQEVPVLPPLLNPEEVNFAPVPDFAAFQKHEVNEYEDDEDDEDEEYYDEYDEAEVFKVVPWFRKSGESRRDTRKWSQARRGGLVMITQGLGFFSHGSYRSSGRLEF